MSLNEKAFSTGLDLKYMSGRNNHDIFTLLIETQRLMGRLHAFPVPTIALINGYAIAGGENIIGNTYCSLIILKISALQ